MTPIQVHILTYCRRIDQFYGTELVFRTLRTGFPHAEVHVVDNASVPEARAAVARLAREHDCRFEQLPDPAVPHHAFLRDTLCRAGTGPAQSSPLVFLDPDVCLWESCEDFRFDGLIAGMLVDAHDDGILGCIAAPRLHSSFLWIQHPGRLLEEVQRLQRRYLDFEPFLPYSVRVAGSWIRFDTGASLFAALGVRVSLFGEEHLRRYDHIYCGSHYDLFEGKYGGELGALMQRIHELARAGDVAQLRGIRQLQDAALARHYGATSPPVS